MELTKIYIYLTYKWVPYISCLRASAHAPYGEYVLDHQSFQGSASLQTSQKSPEEKLGAQYRLFFHLLATFFF